MKAGHQKYPNCPRCETPEDYTINGHGAHLEYIFMKMKQSGLLILFLFLMTSSAYLLNPIAQYSFNSNDSRDDVSGVYNGTISSGVINTTGVIGNGMAFNGTGYITTNPRTLTINSTRFGITMFVNTAQAATKGIGRFITYDPALYVSATTGLHMYWANPYPPGVNCGNTLDGNYHALAFTGNGTHVLFYLDRAFCSATSIANLQTTNYMEIGRADSYLTGSIDEWYFFNRTINSSEVSMLGNIPPTITSAYLYNNQSLFANQTILMGSINAADPSNSTLTVYYNWFKNGVNQTALAGTTTITNSTTGYFNTTAPNFTAADKWSLQAIISDGLYNTSVYITPNATVQTFPMTTGYTTVEYDTLQYAHNLTTIINSTITDATAYFQIGGVNYSGSRTINATNGFFQYNLVPPIQSANTSTQVIYWVVYTTPTGTLTTSTQYNITIVPAGLFQCNATYSQNSVNYTFKDAETLTTINGSLTAALSVIRADSTYKTYTLSGTNTTLYACIYPTNSSYSITANEVSSATGYNSVNSNRAYTATNSTQMFVEYLYNSTNTKSTVLKVMQSPAIPLPGIIITIEKYTAPSTYTFIQSCTTEVSGTCTVNLIPTTTYYRYNMTYQGVPYSFGAETVSCDASSATCYRTFILGSSGTVPAYFTANLTGSCLFVQATGTLTCSATDTTNTLVNMSLLVANLSGTVCSQFATGASNTMQCVVSTTYNTSYAYTFYGQSSNGNNYILSSGQFTIGGNSNRWGRDAWLGALVVFVCMALGVASNMYLSGLFGFGAIGALVWMGILPVALGGQLVIMIIVLLVIVYRLKV